MRSVLAAATMLAACEGSVLAQQAPALCGDRRDVLTQFTGRPEGEPTQFGMIGSAVMIELITSDSGGWTVLFSLPDGSSCLLDQTESWEPRRPPPLGRSR